jgi:DNA-binding CsgD family transcriptional regulator
MSINIRKGKAEDGGFILEGNIHVTRRELEALVAIAEGNDNESAAKQLGISYTTLRNHTYNIMKKLGAKNRTEALVKAVENRMIYIGLKGDTESKTPGNYFVCIYCGRAFNWRDIVTVHEEPFVVNHVKYHPPDWPKCPHEDCNGNALNAYSWRQVKNYHPEYPEVPEKDVVYSTSELIEAESRAYELSYEEWRRSNQE